MIEVGRDDRLSRHACHRRHVTTIRRSPKHHQALPVSVGDGRARSHTSNDLATKLGPGKASSPGSSIHLDKERRQRVHRLMRQTGRLPGSAQPDGLVLRHAPQLARELQLRDLLLQRRGNVVPGL